MNELLILCEGDLEKKVLCQFLQPYWSQHFRDCIMVNYEGNGGFKGNVKSDAKRHLSYHKENYVLCLLDLYQAPYEIYDRTRMTHAEGFIALQNILLSYAAPHQQQRFGAFPVVMEIEPWLLADPNIQEKYCGGTAFPLPETEVHPRSALQGIFKERRKRYRETIEGAQMFSDASAIRIYEDSAPHFRLIIDWLIAPPRPEQPVWDDTQDMQWRSQLKTLYNELDHCEKRFDAEINDEIRGGLIRHSDELHAQINQLEQNYPSA